MMAEMKKSLLWPQQKPLATFVGVSNLSSHLCEALNGLFMRKAIDISLSRVYDCGLGAHTSKEFSVGRATGAMMRDFQNLGTELLRIVLRKIDFRLPLDIASEEDALAASIIAADQGLIIQIGGIEV